MSEEAKIGIVGIGIGFAIYAGAIVTMIAVPIFIALTIIDFFLRIRYKEKQKEYKSNLPAITVPWFHGFEVRLIDGVPVVGWDVVLPGNTRLEVYRIEGHAGSDDMDEVRKEGVKLISTTHRRTNSIDEVFVDYDAPLGTLYYVPALVGNYTEKRLLDYSFLGLYWNLQFTERKKRIDQRVDGFCLRYDGTSEVHDLPDSRSDIERMKDEILHNINAKKKREQEVEQAIETIKQNASLSASEKELAIEMLETRAEQ